MARLITLWNRQETLYSLVPPMPMYNLSVRFRLPSLPHSRQLSIPSIRLTLSPVLPSSRLHLPPSPSLPPSPVQLSILRTVKCSIDFRINISAVCVIKHISVCCLFKVVSCNTMQRILPQNPVVPYVEICQASEHSQSL